jgi:hypothetical protein
MGLYKNKKYFDYSILLEEVVWLNCQKWHNLSDEIKNELKQFYNEWR